MSFHEIHPFLVSLLLSLVIGIERERSHPKGEQAAGVRTFMLFGLLGTLASYIGDLALSIGIIIFVPAVVILGYLRQKSASRDVGLTTEVSAVMVFGLGYLAATEPFLALLLGLTVFTILFSRPWLHRFSREILKPSEIKSALVLAILLIGVVPFIPDRNIDPWGLINPRKLASIISALAVIQFASYVAIRSLGARAGLLLSGFFGGLVSSTSVFATLPARVHKAPQSVYLGVAAAVLATVSMLLECIVVVAVASPPLTQFISVPILAMSLVGFLIAYSIGRKSSKSEAGGIGETANPLDIKSVLKLSVFIFLSLTVVSAANLWLGRQALQATVFLGSLFELHGVIFSTANLAGAGKLQINDAVSTVTIAIFGAFVSKFGLLWILDRGQFAILTSLALILLLVVGGGVFWVTSLT